MPSKAATTPKRFIEILPVDLLRDAGAGASPLHCDISLGGSWGDLSKVDIKDISRNIPEEDL